MSRIHLPAGDLPDTARLFSMNPALGKALAGLSQAIYSQTAVDLRVREAVRMRIAHINQCTLCVGFRFPQQAAEFAACGIDEAFYAAITDWRNSALFSEREKIAIDYAERFAQDHLSLDDGFFARLHQHFCDEEIFTLTTIIAGLMANGRILQVLDVGAGELRGKFLMRLFFSRQYVLFITMACLPCFALAGEIEPRAYVNTPVGVNFMLLGYAYSDGGLSTPAASPIKDAELTMDTEILAYARSFSVMGKSAKFDMIVPYTDLEGSALVAGQPRERSIEGLHDPRFRFSMNFYGAPALSLDEFTRYQQDLIVGASVQVSAPVGQYDDDRLVNLGSHRWYIKPDIGISKAWGDLALELSSGVYLFTDNDEYLGSKSMEQDPLYTSQLHLTYNFARGAWLAVSATSDNGGRTSVEGVESDDVHENSRIGATLAVSLNKNNSIKIYASDAIHTSAGSDYSMVGAIWQYRWGGGL